MKSKLQNICDDFLQNHDIKIIKGFNDFKIEEIKDGFKIHWNYFKELGCKKKYWKVRKIYNKEYDISYLEIINEHDLVDSPMYKGSDGNYYDDDLSIQYWLEFTNTTEELLKSCLYYLITRY